MALENTATKTLRQSGDFQAKYERPLSAGVIHELAQLAQLGAGFVYFAWCDLNRINWLDGAKRGFWRVVPT